MRRYVKLGLYFATALSSIQAGSAFAQEEKASDDSSNAIVVTARRVEERLQDVPISITVFNQQQVSSRNIVTAVDLATFTPSLSSSSRFGSDNASFAIRGFTQDRLTQPSVGTYFADVVVPRGAAGGTNGGDIAPTGSFFDLQNVQVLKGPQGTLFGRNTTGGAVLLVPQKPTNRLEGYLEGSYGSYDMQRVQAVLNVPVSDSLRIRAGVDAQKRDGYLKNYSSIGPKDFGNIGYVAARLSIVADLAPNVENYTIGTFNRSSTNGLQPVLTTCFPTIALAGRIPIGKLACDQLSRLAGKGRFAVESTLRDPVQRTKTWQITNTTTWRASDDLTVKNIISYAELRTFQRLDLFGANFLIPSTISNPAGTVTVPTGALAGAQVPFVVGASSPNGFTNKQRTFVEELQFQGRAANGKLNWQAGAYYEQASPMGWSGSQNATLIACTDVRAFQCTDVFAQLATSIGAASTPPGVAIPAIGTVGQTLSQMKTRTVGLYAQGTYKFTDQLSVTGGIRYTWDRARAQVQAITYRLPTSTPVGFCVDATLRAPTLAITDPTQCLKAYSKDTGAPTWLISLEYKPSADALLYAKYSRGYRGGGIAIGAAAGFETFEAEKVDAYEVGAKLSFHGAVSGSFNVAGFYNKLTNQQLSIGFRSSTPGVSSAGAIVNAGRSRIYGLEVEASLNPFKGFSLSANYAYLNTKLVDQAPIVIQPGSLYDIPNFVPNVGGRLPFAPSNKVSITANYTLPLDERIGKITFGAVYTHTDDVFVLAVDAGTKALLDPVGLSQIGNNPAYDIVNLNVNWNDIGGQPIDAQFFMTNAFNEEYRQNGNIQPTQGFVSEYRAEPRMYGVRLRYRFGG